MKTMLLQRKHFSGIWYKTYMVSNEWCKKTALFVIGLPTFQSARCHYLRNPDVLSSGDARGNPSCGLRNADFRFVIRRLSKVKRPSVPRPVSGVRVQCKLLGLANIRITRTTTSSYHHHLIYCMWASVKRMLRPPFADLTLIWSSLSMCVQVFRMSYRSIHCKLHSCVLVNDTYIVDHDLFMKAKPGKDLWTG